MKLVALLESNDKREVLKVQQELLDALTPDYDIDLVERVPDSGWFDLLVTNSKMLGRKLTLYNTGNDGWDVPDGRHISHTSKDILKIRSAILSWFDPPFPGISHRR